ncbi:MAG: hypothetical protein JXJ17_10660 [Anaerolineae bacterium]|nr:hypothetical protein [Anaerolineae bacterium]
MSEQAASETRGSWRRSLYTKNDRFGEVLVIALFVVFFGLGLLIQQRASNRLWTYSSREAGIDATYPAGWLLDEQGDYVARFIDPKKRPFKTQFMISVVPAGGEASIRTVLDSETVQRSSDLAAYRVLEVGESTEMFGDTVTMDFAYVDADPNPFVQRLPVVVLGRDILFRDGDRVVILTYMAQADSFDEGLPTFERFLSSIQY